MKFPRVGTTRRLIPPRVGKLWICVLATAAAIAFASVAGQGLQQAANQNPPPEVVRATDSNQPNKTDNHQTKPSVAPAVGERRKQISEDSANLLKLATELKTEVDKTSKDTLSLTVIRKAGAIEKLAHDVKENMKLSAGTN
jgi:hypothetical protein